MTQVQSTIPVKVTGNELSAAEQNNLVQDTVNANATDAEARFTNAVVIATSGGQLNAVNTTYDPDALGIATFTLATPTAALNGAERFIYRKGGASNYITITGNICANSSGQRVIGLIDEFIGFKCDGVTWLESSHSLVSFSTLSQTSSDTFSVTTGYTKLTTWDTVIFSTPGKLTANLGSDQIDVLDFEGPLDGYKIDCTISFEYTNNKIVTAQIAVDGTPVSSPVTVNSLGAGKPVTIVIDQAIGVLSTGNIAIQILSETAGTLTSLTGRFTVSRIKG